MGLAIGLVVLAIGFGLIEWKWPAITKRWWRRGMATDLIYWFFTPVVTKALAVVAVVIVATVAALIAGVPLDVEHVRAFTHRATWWSELPVAVQVALVFVLGDLFAYWLHRAFHRGRLWRFHAIHHSSKDLDWLSATRLHPVKEILTRVLQAIPLLALGLDIRVVGAFVPIASLYAIALHANVSWTFGPLRYVLASPTFHRWHHTSEEAGLDKNFAGLFPIWDLMFGTFYLPAHRPTRFGVSDPVPDGIIGQLVWPFRRAR